MRNIKFRAWDTTEKKMHHEISLMFANDLNGVFEGLNECGCIVMQYTGLKDKNCKEIYEGDIVKWFGYEVKSGRQVRPERTMCINDYVKDTYRIFCITDNTGQTVEIIGNIHENKELMEESHE